MTFDTRPFAMTLMAIALSATVAGCGKSTPPPEAPPTATAAPIVPPPSTPVAPDTSTSAAADTSASSAEPTTPELQTKIPITLISDKGIGADAGSISIGDGASGLVLKTDLKGLPPGDHGFHVHQNPDCGAKEKAGKITAGEAAGEHFDPAASGKHAGPDGAGHAGDMPRLTVGADGKATATLIAPRLKVAELKGRSLMIHAEPDDYAGMPGGARIACGVVPS